MKIKNLLAASYFITCITACSSQVPLPSNVSVTPSGSMGGLYIDKIDFSYSTPNIQEFAKLKLCIAENITNNTVNLRDSVGSFVGSYTGNYYQTNNTQTISGGGIFKYLDDSTSTVIANGTTVSDSNALLLTKDFIKFEVKAATNNNHVTLIFSNITRAQQNTGSLSNDGFNPVGVWSGARAPDIYTSIESVANKIKTCLN